MANDHAHRQGLLGRATPLRRARAVAFARG
jgi:hypothetical protein